MDSLHDSLDDANRAKLRATFAAEVSAGHKMPFVVPYTLFAAFIIPTLWLSISQKRYPWVYTTRWPLAAFIIAFNLHVTSRTSSGNLAISYATGLLAGWGIIYNLNLMIWTRPQATAARIVRRRNMAHGTTAKSLSRVDGNTSVDGPTGILRQRGIAKNATGQANRNLATNGHAEDDGSKYVWQPFPHEAPWRERSNWALDLTTSFRGCGWNWAISSVPQPKRPGSVEGPTPVDMESCPVKTPAGYTRCTQRAEFIRKRLLNVALTYTIIDFLAITMSQDPYFVLGPDHRHEAPPHLSWLHPILLLWLRQLMSLSGFIAAISGMMTANALLQYHLAPYLIPSREELWHYPSIFGDFTAVLDRGLAGWWGIWWHQTFRAQFLAPATFLLREGYYRKGETLSKIVALAISFGQSGILHAFGSWTTIPETRPWRAPAFFALQAVGIVIQEFLSSFLRSYIEARNPTLASSRLCRRVGNFAFTLLWIQWTSVFFCDDIASTGLWLCDPVPFSPLRMLGLGRAGDRWWRWERAHYPGWYTGEHWWESGVAF
ncbi:hypothetical protein NLU13_2128 [Sarocladium strictum]|uniref:Wax synthase domain-containing protein n=1 Tax=Sarocladium strictum TaxID=5046 RepID=A0AA39GS87_SARSR|nr:hypothetical protein NLU13_2128 [Sarocladium strictum]